MLKRRVFWALIHLAVFTFMYLGFYERSEGALNVLGMITWIYIVRSFFFLKNDIVKDILKDGCAVPDFLVLPVNVVIIGVFSWFGWFVTAIFWFISSVIILSAYNDIAKGKKGV